MVKARFPNTPFFIPKQTVDRQSLRTQLPKIGVENALLICNKDGSMHWINIPKYVKIDGESLPYADTIKIDPDRAVAAGASWGGYAIKSE